jgi:multicomponent Na+:H+ antiporter subunit D
MSDMLVIVPLLQPFVTAVVMLLVLRRWPAAQRVFGTVSLLALIGVELVLMSRLRGGEVLAHRMGNWPAPFGIVLMADMLSGIMLLLASITALAAYVFGLRDADRERQPFHFHPLYQLLLMGINGAFLTGDLFNLFVWFEVLLIASYALLTLGGEPRQLRAGIPYVALNLMSSTFFLVAAAILYGVAGTLNMADLWQKLAALEGQRQVMAQVAAVTLLCVFGIKAGLVPLYFWLPDAYPAPPAAVATFFAGIMTKVGVYSLLRVFVLVFGGTGFAASLLLPIAGFTMIVGVLGAICQTNFRRLLSFHIISQVGFMVMGIGMFTPLGIAGGIIYIIHHIMVKAGLFLIAGVGERVSGQQDIEGMGGYLERYPALATLFFIAGSSLAGVPPFSGFFVKFMVIGAGFEIGAPTVVAAALVASLLTLFSMMKVWQYVFWRKPAASTPSVPGWWYGPVVLLVSFSLTLSAFAGPLYRLGTDAANQLLDRGRYVRAVLGTEAGR